MFNVGTNQIVLLLCVVLVTSTGTYLTYFRQASTLESLKEEVQAKQKEQERVQQMYTQLASTEEQAQKAVRQWQTRYKLFPETITTPEIVGYLTELTQNGFKTFDIQTAGAQNRDGYSFHTFRASGKAYFYHLYRFLWKIENNRSFYRVRNVELSHVDERTTDEETGRTDMDILVSFDMQIDAFYGAPGGIENEDLQPAVPEIERLPVAQTNHRPPVPSHVLPDAKPELDPFYPIVMQEIPPNQYGRLNIETATLTSIVQGEAVFKTEDGFTRLGEGDRVYLGRIIDVDPEAGTVVARLNKGGIVDTVERALDLGSPLDRVRGTRQVSPIEKDPNN